MANNQIMVNMKFQADTTQAKAKMQELQNSLAAIGQVSNQNLPMNQLSMGLDKAKVAAAQLQIQLKNAFNQNTGKLDLSRFIQQMNQSNMSLEKYKASLMQAGPAGQKAFAQLATSVASADTHVIRISERMQKLGQAFANTIRWQISSAALMGITSTLSEAYQFAQDLNQSLTDIRIVTGYSADYMKDFAEEANKAAKALSTTTTEYTKASLIYFQQGLGDKAVKERTDLTIKMANVTGQSVNEVSDQLTAVWNNFDNGTKSLEHYVDVMVALGAATASSSEEISEGLNKFAAVAETVGLSYEYAASALATVTATTRQSADVVGTAFKTLFARIQDLELGKTLEDGTSLGQYSQALAAVGINIKDVNGDVKQMNTILDEMGEKWNTLSKDSQIALAQNIAGVRQYTQLIALMDNWDFFKENLNTSLNSSGSLQEQADIYAESWRAARDKVTASLEDIYKTLLDDKAFINILKFFADFIENINGVIDSVGGLRGVILLLTTALMNMGKIGIANQMTSISTSMMAMTKTGREYLSAQRDKALTLTTSMYDTNTDTGRLQNDALKNKVQLEREFYDLSRNMNEQEKATLQILKDQLATEQQNTEEKIEQFETTQSQLATEKFRATKNYGVDSEQLNEVAQKAGQNQSTQRLFDQVSMTSDINATNLSGYFSGDLSDQSLDKASSATTNIIQQMEALKFGVDGADAELIEMFGEDGYNRLNTYYEKVKALAVEINGIKEKPIADREKIQETNKIAAKEEVSRQARMKELEEKAPRSKDGTKILGKEYSDLSKASKEYNVNLQRNARTSKEAKTASQDLEAALQAQNDEIGKSVGELVNSTNGNEKATAAIHKTVKASRDNADAHYEAALATGQDADALKRFNQQARDIVAPIGMAQRITTMASAAMSAAMALQALNSVVTIWKDEDASIGDKLLQTVMSLGMVIPMVTSSFSRLNVAKMFGLALDKDGVAFMPKKLAADGAEIAATSLQTTVQTALNASLGTTLLLYGAMLLAVIAVVGIIYLIVNAISKQESALEKVKKAQENYNQALTEANESLTEANQHLEDMKTLLGEIAETQNAFDELIKGSTKWQENLEKNNEKILELLELYPELENVVVNGQKLIDFKDGIYQITNQDALAQYVEGTATINKNINEVAAARAQRDKNIQDRKVNIREIVEGIKTNTEINNEKETVSSDNKKVFSTLTLGTEQKEFQTKDGSSILTDNRNDLWNTKQLKNAALDYIQQGKTINEAVDLAASEMKYDLPQESIDFIKKGLNSIKELTDAEKQLIEARNAELPSVTALSQSILSTRQGYSNLLSNDQQLSTMIYSQKLNSGMTNGLFSSAAEKEKLGENDANELAKIVLGKDKSSQTNTGSWKNYFSSTEGKQILNAYAKETYGEKLEFKKDSLGATEFTDDERTIEYQAVLNWANAKNVIETEDVTEMFKQVESYSDNLVAAVTDNVLTLTQKEVDALSAGITNNSEEYKKQIEQLAKDLNTDVETLTDNLKQNLSEYRADLAESFQAQQDIDAGNAIINENAGKFELEAEALKIYAKNLKDVYNSYEIAAKAAVINAKYTKGIENLGKALKDSTYQLYDWKETGELTYESAETLSAVITALTDVFGVEVSADFVSKNLEKIEQLVEGGQEAVQVMKELELAAAQDYVASLNLTTANEDIFNGILEELTKLEEDNEFGFEVGLDVLDENYVKQLNDMIASGQTTAEEIQKGFEAIGWSPNFVSETMPLPPTTTYTYSQTSDVDTENPLDIANSDWGKGQWQRVQTRTQMTAVGLGEKPKVTYTGRSNTTVDKASGGGGSKSKKKQKKQNDVDKYHEEKEALSDLQRQLEKISKAKDRAFGGERLSLINEEIAALEREQKATESLAKAQMEDAKAQGVKLADKYGAQFDENGRVTNWEQIHTEANALYDAEYEKSSDKRKEELDEWLEELKKGFEDYETVLNEAEENSDKAAEQINEIFDKKLEKIDYKIEVQIEIDDRELQRLEKQLEKLQDPIRNAFNFSLISKNIKEQFKLVEKDFQSYEKGIIDVFGETVGNDILKIDWKSSDSVQQLQQLLGDKNLTSGQIEALQKYQDGINDTITKMEELRTTAFEQVQTSFETLVDEGDKASSKIEHLTSILNTYQDVIDIVGTKSLKISDDTLRQLSKQRVAATQTALEQARLNKDEQEKYLKQYQTAFDNATTDEEKKKWADLVDMATASVQEAEANLNSAWTNTLQAAADDFETSVDITLRNMEKGLAGQFESLAAMQESYDQQQDMAERYLKDYEKVYEISKLNRDINKSINSIDSVKGKQELLELQEEINKLEESGAEVSQYDLDAMRKKYELRLAEIALEDAQNNKSIVRMRRDSEGNMSYVYTADNDATTEKQQNYEDKLYESMQFNQDYATEKEGQVIQNRQEMMDKLRELRREDYESEQKYLEAVQQIRDFYNEKEKYIVGEMQKALDNNKIVYDNDYMNYTDYVSKKTAAESGLKTTYDQTFLALSSGYTTTEQLRDSFETAYDTMLPKLEKSWEDFESASSYAFWSAGYDMDDFGKNLPGKVNTITGELDKVPDAFNTWKYSAYNAVIGLINELDSGELHNWFTESLEWYQDEVDNLNLAINTTVSNQANKSEQKPKEQTTPKETKTNNTKVQASAPSKNTTSSSTLSNYNNEGYSVEQVKAAQSYVGLTGSKIDGAWGKNSAAAAQKAGYSSLKEVIEAMSTYSTQYWGDLNDYKINSFNQRDLKNIALDTNIIAVKNPGERSSSYIVLKRGGLSFSLPKTYKFVLQNLGITSIPFFRNSAVQPYIGSGDLPGINSFDTGGYTGSWDSSGRLAMLHQKEIVLNAADTENFLAAINIVRDIAKAIDLQAVAYQSTLGSMVASTNISMHPQTVQQDVVIHAEFPNATNRSEIEAAFDNLINRASQFANRKN